MFNNEKEMKSLMGEKLPSHKCDPKKVVEAQNSRDIENKQKQVHKELIDFLVLIFGQSTVVLYLKAEELALPYPDFSLAF